MLIRLFLAGGFDKAVSVTLLSRVWSVVGGLATIFFVTRFLSPEIQGYYYTFNSLIALQIFVELGLNFAIIQFVSHEMAALSWGKDGTVNGSPESKCRLQSLLRFALVWFCYAALAMIIIVVPLGLFFFHYSGGGNALIRVEAPWIFAVVLAALGLFGNAFLAILEGCNKVSEATMIRLAQALLSTVTVWAVLAAGGKLFAFPIAAGISCSVGFVLLATFYRRFFYDLLTSRLSSHSVKWKSGIWPFQWRIAVSCASGYLIFHLFNPLLFATHGPAVAGQLGMSLQIIAAMNSAAMAWITTKAPLFGQYIARGERTKLNQLFNKVLIQSTLFLLAGMAAVMMGVTILSFQHPAWGSRVVSSLFFGYLCVICLANHIVSAEAAFLRAHKKEPFMWLSVATGVVIASLAVLLIPAFGTSGAIVAYAFGAIGVSLVGGTLIFMRKRAEWSIPTQVQPER